MAKLKKDKALRGLNPHQLGIYGMLRDFADEDGNLEDKLSARVILRNGKEIRGTLTCATRDGGLAMSPEKRSKIGGTIYVDLREVVVLEW